MNPSRSDHRSDMKLPADVRHLHRTLLNILLATGDLPLQSALAADLGISQAALDARLQTLVKGDYLAFDGAGHPTCLYPYSVDPTRHAITIDGKRRFAMCALDALGMAAMLDRALDIESACPICGTPIRLTVRPGVVTRVEPTATMVVARRHGNAPAHEACCDFTNFTCSAAHAAALVANTPNATAVDLETAFAAGEALFAGLLDETLPSKRTHAAMLAEGA